MLMARPFVYKVAKTGETGIQDDPQRPPNLEHLMLMARPFVYSGKTGETRIQDDPQRPPNLEHLMQVGKPGQPGYRTIPKDPQT